MSLLLSWLLFKILFCCHSPMCIVILYEEEYTPWITIYPRSLFLFSKYTQDIQLKTSGTFSILIFCLHTHCLTGSLSSSKVKLSKSLPSNVIFSADNRHSLLAYVKKGVYKLPGHKSMSHKHLGAKVWVTNVQVTNVWVTNVQSTNFRVTKVR